MKTAIALSGGVDSAVAAYLLKQQGHDLVGVFMRFWHELDDSNCANCVENKCCSRESLIRIKKICIQLDIPLLIFNFEKEFKKAVVDKFIKFYQSGKTPNPCIWCNEEIKFKLLLKEATKHDIDNIATGHYARIQEVNEYYYIRRSLDKTKDQSYFLYRVSQRILKNTIFPLGETIKKDNLAIAKKIFPQLKFDQQKESQDLCFFPESSYKPFLLRHSQKLNQPGDIVNEYRKVIGRHDGLINYTVGQRKGIKIGGGPIYHVKKIDVELNQIIVTDRKNILCDEIVIKKIIKTPILENIINQYSLPGKTVIEQVSNNSQSTARNLCYPGGNGSFARALSSQISNPTKSELDSLGPGTSITAQIRFGHQPAAIKKISQNRDIINCISTKELKINLSQPQFAPTPGQHCVFVLNDLVVGGGEIC